MLICSLCAYAFFPLVNITLLTRGAKPSRRTPLKPWKLSPPLLHPALAENGCRMQSPLHISKHTSHLFFSLFDLAQSHDLSLPALLHPALPMTHSKVISLGLFGELLVPVFGPPKNKAKREEKTNAQMKMD